MVALGTGFNTVLTWRSARNGGISWVSGWKPWKVVAGVAACENHRGIEVMWTDGGKRLWAEEYNRTYKAHRRSRCDSLREIKSKYTRRKENKKSTCPGNTYAQKRPEKMLHLHVGLINEGFPPYTVSVQRLGEYVIFSNVQFSTKDHKAYKHMLGLPWWSSR